MINSGDTAFMLVATALVMFMTPGLSLFYGGLVRSKNVLTTVLHSFICLGIVFSIVVTSIICKIIDMTIGLRVSDEEEVQGLDLSQHSEVGYTF